MKKSESKALTGTEHSAEGQLPGYVPPKIVTYTSEELLEAIGPALACSPSPCGIPGGRPGQAAPPNSPKR